MINKSYIPTFKARYSDDKQTKEILKTAVNTGAAGDVYATQQLLQKLGTEDTYSLSFTGDDDDQYAKYEIKNNKTDASMKILSGGGVVGMERFAISNLKSFLFDRISDGSNKDVFNSDNRLITEDERGRVLLSMRSSFFELSGSNDYEKKIDVEEEKVKQAKGRIEDLRQERSQSEKDFVLSLIG